MQTSTEPLSLWDVVISASENSPHYSSLRPWLPLYSPVRCDPQSIFLHPSSSDIPVKLPPFLHDLFVDLVHSSTGKNPVFLATGNPAAFSAPSINAAYSFRSFFTCSVNRLASAAFQAVSETPGRLYNPLFLHAPLGLGKTHLLHALYQRLRAAQPALSVQLLSASSMAQIYSESSFAAGSASSAFASTDALLLDDLHRLEGHSHAEQSLLSAFEHLYHAGKQIVLTSNVHPRHLVFLSEALISRLQWGLVVQIEPFTSSLRKDFLLHKAAALDIALPASTLDFLAVHAPSSTREIESLFHNIRSHVSLLNVEPDIELVRSLLRSHVDRLPCHISLSNIQSFICEYFSIEPESLASKTRVRSIAYPRQIAMYLAHTMTSSSLEEIGRFFGGRDHSTVKHGCEKIRRLLVNDSSLRAIVQEFRRHVSAAC